MRNMSPLGPPQSKPSGLGKSGQLPPGWRRPHGCHDLSPTSHVDKRVTPEQSAIVYSCSNEIPPSDIASKSAVVCLEPVITRSVRADVAFLRAPLLSPLVPPGKGRVEGASPDKTRRPKLGRIAESRDWGKLSLPLQLTLFSVITEVQHARFKA